MTPADADRKRTAAFWDASHERGDPADSFLQHPLLQLYVSLRAFGDARPHMQALFDAVAQYTAPGARLLSVGCGAAIKEQALCQALPDRHVVGIDLAADTVARAARGAAAAGIENLSLEVGDFNALDLAADSYDAILGLGALHHIRELESFWQQCRRALRPGGHVIGQEYIGPSQFQWTAAQVEHGNRALAELVPPALRGDCDVVERIAVDDLIAVDPSEAVRSAEILPTATAAGFGIDEYRGGGGGLLQPLLHTRLPAFDPLDFAHNEVLFALCEREQSLADGDVLGDTYAMFVLAAN